jgi:hypothetical protein
MASKHGNKIYFQLLLDPARALLLEQQAQDKGVKATALARAAIYEWLASTTDSSVLEAAEALDKARWKQSVQHRVEGRRQKAMKAKGSA